MSLFIGSCKFYDDSHILTFDISMVFSCQSSSDRFIKTNERVHVLFLTAFSMFLVGFQMITQDRTSLQDVNLEE